MPKRKSQATSDSENESEELNDSNEDDEIFIPDPEDSGEEESNNDLDDELSDEDNDEYFSKNVSYAKIQENYSENQKKLEPNHIYNWKDNENIFNEDLNDELLLSESIKKEIFQQHTCEIV